MREFTLKNGQADYKARKGSELQAYFAIKRRQFCQSSLPEGFQSKTSVEIGAVGDLIKAKGIENSGR